MYSLENDHGVLSDEEVNLVRQSLGYMDKKVKEVMTPRSVVVTVEEKEALGPINLDKLHKSGQSRFPVINKNMDHVVGMLYMHDLVPLPKNAKQVSDIMKSKVYYVNENKNLNHVLNAFLRTKHHLFIVVNEFEETTGVISIEDIIEQIIGRKIVDEFDKYEDLRTVAKLVAAKRKKSTDGKRI
jgi:CBS domain containing-hemolysin-like protein